MYTIKNYLNYYKNISFKDVAFNEVDNILFSELSYLNWKDIVNQKKITLNQAINIYLKKKPKEIDNKFLKGIIENIKIIENSKRYKNCYLSNFKKEVTKDKQFGAICISFNSRNIYVSFEGTDDSISGWKENFSMTYTFPTNSMTDAISYLNSVIRCSDQTIYVGGHSKGGNLAIIASMYAKNNIKKRIKSIYSNDGPGFTEEIFNSKEMKSIKDKIKLLIPGGSIVGSLMHQPNTFKIIKSNNFSFWEHDCNSWEVFGSFFVETNLSKKSLDLNKRSITFLKEFDFKTKKEMIETIFSILEKNNIKTFEDLEHLSFEKFTVLLLSVKNIDEKTRKLILNGMKKILFNEKKELLR